MTDLVLDLENFRTIPQSDEAAAVQAMVVTSPDPFWALMSSLLDDGYLPTDTIIVLRKDGVLVVKEGNRRVACLKLIHGILPLDTVAIPAVLKKQIQAVTASWKTENLSVPCAIYEIAESAKVDRIVSLAHGKGEKASRDRWNSVASARHNRKMNHASEPALDLLEKYFTHGKNLTPQDKAIWAAKFPLSILDEAMKRLARRLGVATASALAASYPTITDRDALEAIIHDIGKEELGFERIRDSRLDFAVAYGIKALASPGSAGKKKAGSSGASGGSSSTPPPSGKAKTKPKAIAVADPASLKRALKAFEPRGSNRDKVETLRLEALALNIEKTPTAFCFLLRSMFEISAKAYCTDNASAGLTTTDAKGNDKTLATVLSEVTKHLTQGNTDKAMVKKLHGANVELSKPVGLLSVTSMNQLVHNPRFNAVPGDIVIIFSNILPLLEEMNS